MLQPAVTGCTVPLTPGAMVQSNPTFSQALFSERSEHSGLISYGSSSASCSTFGGQLKPHWHFAGQFVV
eukprot:scaffold10178_cov23-Cyclotella_meneghiniana.AAC.2